GDVSPLRFTISNQWAVGARAGFLATARSLWYANAGWTRADFDVTVPSFTLVDKSLNGFFVGGGVEQALSRNVIFEVGVSLLRLRELQLWRHQVRQHGPFRALGRQL